MRTERAEALMIEARRLAETLTYKFLNTADDRLNRVAWRAEKRQARRTWKWIFRAA